MDFPLVSILIPCFNCEEYIEEAIDSALSQTYSKLEVIVFDDGSTDLSARRISRFQKHIKYERGARYGACVARNRAFGLSNGEYINFLDSDDVLHRTKIEEQIEDLWPEGVDLSFCSWLVRYEELEKVERTTIKYPDPEGVDSFIYCVKHPFGTGTFLMRRSIFERVGGFRPGIPKAQETELLWRLGALDIRIKRNENTLCTHRLHNGNRISNRYVEADFILKLFILNSVEMQIRGQLRDCVRRQFVVDHLLRLSDISHRNGFVHSSALGFELAESLSGNGVLFSPYPEDKWKQALVKVVRSPWHAAEVMRWARKVRHRLQRTR